MKYCKDCVGFDECKTTGRTVEFAVDDGVCIDFDERKPQTNADKIRSMSDEELSWFLMLWRCEAIAKHNGVSSEYPNDQKNIMNWLQKPVE